jgi:hypothetical protein
MSYKIVVWGKLIEKWVLDEESQEYNGQIELHSSEEDLVNYIRNNCSIKQGASYEGIAKEILSLLQGEKEGQEGKPEDIMCPVCGYYCLGKGGMGCIDKPSIVKPKEEKSCESCKYLSEEDCPNNHQMYECVQKGYSQWQPKEKKEEKKIDWERIHQDIYADDMVHQQHAFYEIVDILKSLYEQVFKKGDN